MPFINYDLLSEQYSDNKMKENVRKLKDYDIFHCLLAGNDERRDAVTRRVLGLPQDFLKWLGACDGGVLFDVTMLSTKSYDEALDLSFETYGDYYNSDLREVKQIQNDWFVFGVAIHADLYFFDMSKNDGRVYQWDVDEFKLYAYWPTFEDWLTDQIGEAIELIANEELEPLDIKLED